MSSPEIAGLRDGLEIDFDGLFVRFQVRRESALIAHRRAVALLFEYAPERVKGLDAHADGLGKRRRMVRRDHELLKSTVLSACLPPFRTFRQGTGSVGGIRPSQITIERQSVRGRGRPRLAMDTARIAFAPNFVLLGVPSASIIALSISRWLVAFLPTTTFANSLPTCAAALLTPFPPYRFLSPSRNSAASFSAVEARGCAPNQRCRPSG